MASRWIGCWTERNIRVNVLRRERATAQPYWNSFDVSADGDKPVTWLLEDINHRSPLLDENGKRRSRWVCALIHKPIGFA